MLNLTQIRTIIANNALKAILNNIIDGQVSFERTVWLHEISPKELGDLLDSYKTNGIAVWSEERLKNYL